MRPTHLLRTVLAVLSCCLLAAFTTAAPAVAAGGVTQVSGLLVPDDPEAPQCTDLPSDIAPAGVISGSLVGCWYITSSSEPQFTPSGGFHASGTETFIGCYGARCGELYTTFTFTAKFAADGSEDHGRCHHPIIGGSGGFAGATGVINMHDLPNGCAVYKGHLTFGG